MKPWSFDNTYAKLPDRFYERIAPTPVRAPWLLKLNVELARDLGLDLEGLSREELARIFSGNEIPSGATPIAQAYAGHQFGHFVPQLGDGRAVLLGEIVDRHGQRKDLQLKGSGPTRFSRRGDGRAALGPVLREYILGEAMHHLGIPTTRGLAIATTGEDVLRERPLPGAILTRVASSHVRVGTFEYFAARQDHEAVKILADYVIDRHYLHLKNTERPYVALFREITLRQAKLIAQWMQFGFIHGVMNTDNMAVSGETIDYGPCAFMDEYEANAVFSSIDQQGRYAFGNQPCIALWNLSSLGMCLAPLLSSTEDEAVSYVRDTLTFFEDSFFEAWTTTFQRKLGLKETHEPSAEEEKLVRDFFELMSKHQPDFTLCFRHLSKSLTENSDAASLRTLFGHSPEFEGWLSAWRAYGNATSIESRTRSMLAANPAFIPRNHRVEEAILHAMANDLTPFERLVDALCLPFDDRSDRPELQVLKAAPRPEERVTQTFCGT
jgi:uncharacterized protein YdiU (UPF0061 family)